MFTISLQEKTSMAILQAVAVRGLKAEKSNMLLHSLCATIMSIQFIAEILFIDR